MARVVPVIVIAGFLGSGKTTMLNHFLRQSRGLRIGVVVNDFGAINIDALLVSGQVSGQVSLGNGCICCSVGPGELDDALDSLVRPSAGLDAVVVEASGLAEPSVLLRMIVGTSNPHIAYGGLVYVVDARNFADSVRAHRVLRRHVAMADLVVVNKADLVVGDRIETVVADIREHNRQGTLIVTDSGRVDPRLLLEPARREHTDPHEPRQLGLDELLASECCDGDSDQSDPDQHAHHHMHDEFQSIEFDSRHPLDPRALADYLREPPTGVFRVKGIVWFDLPGHRGGYEVHSVGGHVRVSRHGRHSDARIQRNHSQLVAIGAGIDHAEAETAFARLVRRDSTELDGQAMLAITRYLPG